MVQQFLDQINSAHPALKLSVGDVRHVTWGFLPVNEADANKQPVRLTRDGVVIDHQKKDGITGLISILGVKYTTARVVAEQGMDVAVSQLGMQARKCQTHVTPLSGGKIEEFSIFLRNAQRQAPRLITERCTEHWVYTYGSEYHKLVECVLSHPDMARRIEPPLPVTLAELNHAVHQEMALTLADVIARRTELGSTGMPSMDALQRCATFLGGEFQWRPERQQQEIDSVIQSYPFRPETTLS
jgi:glycerol-3-phosphate dehydrogenase